jgi:hypothetical protein
MIGAGEARTDHLGGLQIHIKVSLCFALALEILRPT